MNISVLHRQAAERLRAANYCPRRWVLIHTAVSLGASLVVALLSLLLSQMVANTGGLSGIGTRSMLQTIQASLELAVMVALPFWNISLIRASLEWVRGRDATPDTFFAGFRRFGPVLRVKILTLALFMGVTILVSNVGTVLFMLTPYAEPLMKSMEPLIQDTGYFSPDLLLTDEAMAQIGSAAVPLLVFFGVLLAAVAIPVWYRVRFADYVVMEGDRARVSMLTSFHITKRKCLSVFKLDLSFWWFYLLQALSVALCYGDSILALLGVALPISAELAYVLFYALGAGCQTLLLWKYQAHISATYALAYESLLVPLEPQYPR